MEKREITFTLTRKMIQDYALASGDQNPIHTDDAVAIAQGLPSSISHGMLVMGICASKIIEFGWVPKLTTYEMSFLSYVLPEEELVLTTSFKNGQGMGMVSSRSGRRKAEFTFT
ncbi:acyl dehydratase [Chryseomicrobium aureum]|uniref:MaoC/PaaZ C-terminal domain-containing protein n=1 Tax=Chryseomicrobium aureum TaxID=1441723 RepID=UPI0019592A50|nr:MaoC/PaaZ C-terminal domain-containing protein [Chryseomicrobium aureum]MBM7707165.1 acyl dehydratase [Chryseomicrobium aureum]